MPDGRTIGTIVKLQVQRSPLKVGERPNRRYDTGPLEEVQRLVVGGRGCVGWLPDGTALLDVHHVDHPVSRAREGGRGLSIGFTSHYAAIRRRFGDRIHDGAAGENVLVASEETQTLDALGAGIGVVSAATGETVWLDGVGIARPCKAFSRYCLGRSDPSADELRDTLTFLDGGTRGFYASVDADTAALFRPGDHLIAR